MVAGCRAAHDAGFEQAFLTVARGHKRVFDLDDEHLFVLTGEHLFVVDPGARSRLSVVPRRIEPWLQ